MPIGDPTQPVAPVDQGGSGTVADELQDGALQAGGGGSLPSLITVTASTDPPAALAAVVAPAPVTAAPVRTTQAARAPRWARIIRLCTGPGPPLRRRW